MKTFEKPIIYIIDGDYKLLNSLSTRLKINDVIVEVFFSAEDFLKTKTKTKTKIRTRGSFLVVEVNLPNMNGIELLEHINNLGVKLPTIVLSSGSEVSEAVRAMQAEAIDYIEKPFIENTLIQKVLNVIGQAE